MTRSAGGVVVAIVLAGCGGGKFGEPPPASALPAGISGRWIMSAPNAPPCGINFSGALGARDGKVAPEGGCPDKFYMSRRWALEQDALVINDDENNPLARLTFSGDRFEGRSATGTPVTLAQPVIPPQ
jgi:hypothetical protein